ncbi:protein TIC 40, chloroplastic-like isoform X2 [Phalaenopsis equestris]|uniref:protein TIC 40, chloroplastic-like isoform X2 n=1 Tax=Phalaenopsis equestris TaxID=78828 RepID=UPI0009E341CC|nr:protein TIC 40, chloroplastic-like isoform X2 [Phalaenopsis equestris]
MESQALASSIPILSCFSKSALPHASRPRSCRFNMLPGASIAWRKLGMRNATRAASSTVDTLVRTYNQVAPTNPISKIGSPLLWIAVGVGLSAWFSVRYAINKAFKAVMGEEAEANGQFNTSAFASGSPFPSLPSQPAEASGEIHIDELSVNIPPADTVINENK